MHAFRGQIDLRFEDLSICQVGAVWSRHNEDEVVRGRFSVLWSDDVRVVSGKREKSASGICEGQNAEIDIDVGCRSWYSLRWMFGDRQ